MDKQEFVKLVIERVGEKFEGLKFEAREVVKNNGVKLTGIMASGAATNVSPTIYIDELYEDYANGRALDGVVEAVCRALSNGMPTHEIDISWYAKWEIVKDKVCFRLVNRDRNAEDLADMPHREFLDLAMNYYVPFEDEEIGEGSIGVRNRPFEEWGVTEEDLYKAAKVNTPKIMKVAIMPRECAFMRLVGMDCSKVVYGPKSLGKIKVKKDCPVLLVTTDGSVFGAAAITYDGVAQKISDAFKAAGLGSDYFVLPSSVHECMVLPVSGNGQEDVGSQLEDMVDMVYSGNVGPQDYLSDSVYLYCAKEGTLTVYGKEDAGKWKCKTA